MERHPALRHLGPDAIAETFDADDVRGRLRTWPGLSIGEGLLLQTAMAGVGNVFKSEILFLERVNPFARIGDLTDDTLDRVITQARRLLILNRRPGFRQTRATLDPDAGSGSIGGGEDPAMNAHADPGAPAGGGCSLDLLLPAMPRGNPLRVASREPRVTKYSQCDAWE